MIFPMGPATLDGVSILVHVHMGIFLVWQTLVEGEIVSSPNCLINHPLWIEPDYWVSRDGKHKTIQKDSHSKIKLLHSDTPIITEVNMAIHKVKANEYTRLRSRRES